MEWSTSDADTSFSSSLNPTSSKEDYFSNSLASSTTTSELDFTIHIADTTTTPMSLSAVESSFSPVIAPFPEDSLNFRTKSSILPASLLLAVTKKVRDGIVSTDDLKKTSLPCSPRDTNTENNINSNNNGQAATCTNVNTDYSPILSPLYSNNVVNSSNADYSPLSPFAIKAVAEQTINDTDEKDISASSETSLCTIYSDDETRKKLKAERPTRQVPNYFISIQFSDPEIYRSLKEVHRSVMKKNGNYSLAMVPLHSLHMTLAVMWLDKEEDMVQAKAALDRCGDELRPKYAEKLLELPLQGLGNFRNSVVFAKVHPGEHIACLEEIAAVVQKKFCEAGLVDENPNFTPHVTVLKLSRVGKKLIKKTGLKKIYPDIYEDFVDTYFGTQKVHSLQLCSMLKAKDISGYYHIDHKIDFGTEMLPDNNNNNSGPKVAAVEEGIEESSIAQIVDQNASETSTAQIVDQNASETSTAQIVDQNGSETSTAQIVDQNASETSTAQFVDQNASETSTAQFVDQNASETSTAQFVDQNASETSTAQFVDQNASETSTAQIVDQNASETSTAQIVDQNASETSTAQFVDQNASETSTAQIVDQNASEISTAQIVDENPLKNPENSADIKIPKMTSSVSILKQIERELKYGTCPDSPFPYKSEMFIHIPNQENNLPSPALSDSPEAAVAGNSNLKIRTLAFQNKKHNNVDLMSGNPTEHEPVCEQFAFADRTRESFLERGEEKICSSELADLRSTPKAPPLQKVYTADLLCKKSVSNMVVSQGPDVVSAEGVALKNSDVDIKTKISLKKPSLEKVYTADLLCKEARNISNMIVSQGADVVSAEGAAFQNFNDDIEIKTPPKEQKVSPTVFLCKESNMVVSQGADVVPTDEAVFKNFNVNNESKLITSGECLPSKSTTDSSDNSTFGTPAKIQDNTLKSDAGESDVSGMELTDEARENQVSSATSCVMVSDFEFAEEATECMVPCNPSGDGDVCDKDMETVTSETVDRLNIVSPVLKKRRKKMGKCSVM